MNQLLALLKKENNLTLPRLKQLYRVMSMEAHPDTGGGTEVKFIKLKRDYEEALSLIDKHQPIPDLELKPGSAGNKNLRERVLDQLIMFALKVFTSEGDIHLRNLIELTREYHREVHEQLKLYSEILYSSYHAWMSNGSIYYPHSLFIAAIKQLTYYSELSHPRYKKLVFSYAEDLKAKADKLKPEQAAVLLRLMSWLKAETDLSD